MNKSSVAPSYNYIMVWSSIFTALSNAENDQVDTDFYLPVLMENYFLKTGKGENCAKKYLKYDDAFELLNLGVAENVSRTKAGMVNPANDGYTYQDLFLISSEKIMETAGRYAAEGNQTRENLVHLNEGEIVGEWRDSTYGQHALLC